jgi:Mg2+ and Co2+ transporter CorA
VKPESVEAVDNIDKCVSAPLTDAISLDLCDQPHQITTPFDEGTTNAPTRSDVVTAAYKQRHPIIDANIRDFERMLSHANASSEALNHLLDLKKSQANALEARLARIGVESGAKQSNTIMVFTVATIFFGSLFFVAAFFALNVTAFPKQADGATTA